MSAFSFYDISNYSSVDSIDLDFYNQMNVLSNFKDNLITLLSIKGEEKSISIGPLIRKISPPIEAYDYVGNNKLNITHSMRSYGLLFE